MQRKGQTDAFDGEFHAECAGEVLLRPGAGPALYGGHIECRRQEHQQGNGQKQTPQQVFANFSEHFRHRVPHGRFPEIFRISNCVQVTKKSRTGFGVTRHKKPDSKYLSIDGDRDTAEKRKGPAETASETRNRSVRIGRKPQKIGYSDH